MEGRNFMPAVLDDEHRGRIITRMVDIERYCSEWVSFEEMARASDSSEENQEIVSTLAGRVEHLTEFMRWHVPIARSHGRMTTVPWNDLVNASVEADVRALLEHCPGATHLCVDSSVAGILTRHQKIQRELADLDVELAVTDAGFRQEGALVRYLPFGTILALRVLEDQAAAASMVEGLVPIADGEDSLKLVRGPHLETIEYVEATTFLRLAARRAFRVHDDTAFAAMRVYMAGASEPKVGLV